MKIRHFLYCPFTGLGLYGGFRGNRWLRNRIKIFKQFVVPSLQAQTEKNFTLWISWRAEEKKNKYAQELVQYLRGIPEFKTVHTFSGVCFWDDKYDDKVAHERLITALHGSLKELVNEVGDVDFVYMTIQPSDDIYERSAVAGIQKVLESDLSLQAFGFSQGYVCNYKTLEIAEWNPSTNPPFFTIKFTKEKFIDPFKHFKHTGPYKSHEYVKDHLKYGRIDRRGFLVGTHEDNISTVFDHPFAGNKLDAKEILPEFGIENAGKLVVPFSLRRRIFHHFPYKVKRKLRYWGERNRFWNIIYNFLRN